MFFFKTRAGSIGLLQIIGFTDNPRGVKIRYKLVQNGVPNASAFPPASSNPILPVADLQFRLVAPEESIEPSDLLSDTTGHQRLQVLKQVLMDGSTVAQASVSFGLDGSRIINLKFTDAGSRQFAEITASHIHQRLAIVYRGKLLSAPNIQCEITGGEAQIISSLYADEIYELVNCLNRTETSSEHSWEFSTPTERNLPVQIKTPPIFGWLDLDSGNMLTNSTLDWESHDGHEWIRSHGLDVVATDSSNNNPVLLGMNSVIVTAPTNAWDTVTAPDVVNNWDLLRNEPRQMKAFGAALGKSDTYIFKTREGGMGLLQLTGFTDNPRGVKLRYKLVQNSTTNPPARQNAANNTAPLNYQWRFINTNLPASQNPSTNTAYRMPRDAAELSLVADVKLRHLSAKDFQWNYKWPVNPTSDAQYLGMLDGRAFMRLRRMSLLDQHQWSEEVVYANLSELDKAFADFLPSVILPPKTQGILRALNQQLPIVPAVTPEAVPQQPTSSAPIRTNVNPGSVIELEIGTLESGTNCFVDFDTGRVLTPPDDVLEVFRQPNMNWMQAAKTVKWLEWEGVDMIRLGSKPGDLRWVESWTVGGSYPGFSIEKPFTPALLSQLSNLKQGIQNLEQNPSKYRTGYWPHFSFSVPDARQPDTNAYILMMTDRRKFGVMQVLQTNFSSPKVKLRYKLVQ
jgi:hypothetical protein